MSGNQWRILGLISADIISLTPIPSTLNNLVVDTASDHRVLVGRPEGKRPLARPRRRWEDNIKMDLREVGYDGRDWINLAQDRDQWRAYVRAAVNLRFLKSQLRVFENKVLREIFGAKRDEVTGEWRKLHNAELHALYSSRDIIRNIKFRRLRWAGHVARMGESRNAYRVLVGRPKGKRPLGRPRRRWEDNIKMDLREVGYDGRDWTDIAKDRDQLRAYVRAAMNLRIRDFRSSLSLILPETLTDTAVLTQEHGVAQITSKSHALGGYNRKCLFDIYSAGLEEFHTECGCVNINLQPSVALYGAETWTLRRSEEKRTEAFEMWIWRRKKLVKWIERIRNEAVLERVGEERMMLKLIQEEEKALVVSLAEKKLATDGCTGSNGEREKSSG
ncbi:hypothetical protein ANN_00463 [Periplaneta americana]|uniref:Uncharacterized protein n=1 Tax=Periplaneta americana TaxID=6978 RepID=A0ABQ8TQU6_PERAM|nr:hypothetical protein ANN_00463 [Periplaneta americana]